MSDNEDFSAVSDSSADFENQDFDGIYKYKPLTSNALDSIKAELGDLNSSIVFSQEGELLQKYLKKNPIGSIHISFYEFFLDVRVESIFNNLSYSHKYQDESRKDGGYVEKFIRFRNPRYLPVRYSRDGNFFILTPQMARQQRDTYSIALHIDIHLQDASGRDIDVRQGIHVGNIPLMLKCKYCQLHGKSDEELLKLGEDPRDPGAYFIVNGTEKTIPLKEQLAFNKLVCSIKKTIPECRMTVNTEKGSNLVNLFTDKKTKQVIKTSFLAMKKGVKNKKINILYIFFLLGYGDPDDIKFYVSLFINSEYRLEAINRLTMTISNYNNSVSEVRTGSGKTRITKEIKQKSKGITKEQLEQKVKARIRELEEGLRSNYLDDLTLKKTDKPRSELENVYKQIIYDDLFPHINYIPRYDNEEDQDFDTRIKYMKMLLLSMMVARILELMAGVRKQDNKNSWINKRIVGAGSQMEQLFRSTIRKDMDAYAKEVLGNLDLDKESFNIFVNKVTPNKVTDTFRQSFVGVNWGPKGTKAKKNIVQTLMRSSLHDQIAHLQVSEIDVSHKIQDPEVRAVGGKDAWGFICPTTSVEGDGAGLIKSVAITVQQSVERDDKPFISHLMKDQEFFLPITVEDFEDDRVLYGQKLMVNGKFFGWCDGESLKQKYLYERRKNELSILDRDVSIILEDDILYFDFSPSRPIRPVVLLDENEKPLIDVDGVRDQSIEFLFREGYIEFISSWEQMGMKIAPYLDSIKDKNSKLERSEKILKDYRNELEKAANSNDAKSVANLEEMIKTSEAEVDRLTERLPFTHVEISPQVIYGIGVVLMPYPNHNQGPRNTYHANMGKQGLSVYHTNYMNRDDGKTKVEIYATKPSITTEVANIIGLDVYPNTTNLFLGFSALDETQEDAIVFCKQACEGGMCRTVNRLVVRSSKKGLTNTTQEFARPPLRNGQADRYRHIQDNGLPRIGAYLSARDCVIGKIQFPGGENNDADKIDVSEYMKVGDEGIVTDVIVTSTSGETEVIVKLRIMRVPQEGDKFSARNAQKNTIGKIMSAVNFYFDKQGVSPNAMVNDHAIISRMTNSYLMELQSGLLCSAVGVQMNGSAFVKFPFNMIRKTLKMLDYDEFGRMEFYSGISGRKLMRRLNCGYIGINSLKHQVAGKIQARGLDGPVKTEVRQPIKGRGYGGGLRIGEMERDCIISHGASEVLLYRLNYASDAYETVICTRCYNYAFDFYGEDNPGYKCNFCDKGVTLRQNMKSNEFCRVVIPYATKYYQHLMGAAGIRVKLMTMSLEKYKAKMTMSLEKNKEEYYTNELTDSIEEEEEDEILEMDEDGRPVDIDAALNEA